MRPGQQREDDIIVVLNYHSKPLRAELSVEILRDSASLVDLMSGDAIPIASEIPTIDLPAWGARVLRRGAGHRVK
jgi:hypothetical protein